MFKQILLIQSSDFLLAVLEFGHKQVVFYIELLKQLMKQLIDKLIGFGVAVQINKEYNLCHNIIKELIDVRMLM